MTVARMLETLEVEAHGRLDGRARLASIFFRNGSVAVVPQSLAVGVWKGSQ